MTDYDFRPTRNGDKRIAVIDGYTALVMPDTRREGRWGFQVRGRGGLVIAKRFGLESEELAMTRARAACQRARANDQNPPPEPEPPRGRSAPSTPSPEPRGERTTSPEPTSQAAALAAEWRKGYAAGRAKAFAEMQAFIAEDAQRQRERHPN